MQEARRMISIFHEMNRSETNGANDRRVARYSPALVGMIGTTAMFDALLSDFDDALVQGKIEEKLKERAKNLSRTFVPQIAALNGLKDLPVDTVTPEDLASISFGSAAERSSGVAVILASLVKVLNHVTAIN